jgi:dTDP-4-amino-4,6-dideoxygalactose transaminase
MTNRNKNPKTKVCSICKSRKLIKHFGKRYDYDAYRSYCRKCHLDKAAKEKSERRAYVSNYKKLKGCNICGYNDERALVLHHKNPKEKTLEVSNMISRNYSSEKIKKELKKCEVLCQNCHAILHHEERSIKKRS